MFVLVQHHLLQPPSVLLPDLLHRKQRTLGDTQERQPLHHLATGEGEETHSYLSYPEEQVFRHGG